MRAGAGCAVAAGPAAQDVDAGREGAEGAGGGEARRHPLRRGIQVGSLCSFPFSLSHCSVLPVTLLRWTQLVCSTRVAVLSHRDLALPACMAETCRASGRAWCSCLQGTGEGIALQSQHKAFESGLGEHGKAVQNQS